MTLVGLVGLIISLIAVSFAFPHRPRNRYMLGFLLLFAHLAATAVNFIYSQSHDADAKGYYFDAYGLSLGPNSLGTVFLVKLVQTMRQSVGGSYFEYFLLFQSFGLVGIIILSRIISSIQYETKLPYSRSSVLILFTPSLHFWTCAIGKDAPLFFASSLAAWSTMRLSSRWIWFAAALVIMVFLRPHIAFISAMALAIALLLDRKSNGAMRILFLLTAVACSISLLTTVGNTFKFDAADPNSVADFISSVQNQSDVLGGISTNVYGGIFIKLFSLLFRPFFVDANGVFGIITSAENAIFLFGFCCLVLNYRGIGYFFRIGVYSKYFCFFTIILTILLAMVYYNVGLGLRQRVMVYPTLLPLFVVGWALFAARSGRSSPPTGSDTLMGSPAPVERAFEVSRDRPR